MPPRRPLPARVLWAAVLACAATTSCGDPPAAPEGPPQDDAKASAFTFPRNARVRREIPLDRIVKGIPRPDPKDGIPAIRSPRSVPAAQVTFLRAEEAVVGVVVGGEARAYAIRYLDRHEVVNDVLGGAPIAVTYCPLCDAAVAARRDLDFDPARRDETLTLGISGYLFDSDVLLYDAETESFWQQIEARAVVGPLTGRTLAQVPVTRTTWRAWRATHPETSALSGRTEYGWPSTVYEAPAYAEYRASSRLTFPIERRSEALPVKAQVYGLSHGGKHLAVPEKALEGREDPLGVDVGGSAFRLVREAGLDAWRAEARGPAPEGTAPTWEPVPLLRCYWFAWYAFHPETEVWEPSRR